MADMSAQVESLTKQGNHKEALSLITDSEKKSKSSVRLRQLKGLVLARLGRLKEAQKVLGALYAEGHKDVETLGIYGRTFMDRYDKAGNKRDLRRSRDLYAEAFEISPTDYYTGINAAAKSVLLGERNKAEEFAKKVHDQIGSEPKKGDYWLSATIAEVELIQGNNERASELYRKAVEIAPEDIGSQASTWLQAKRLMEAMSVPETERAKVALAFRHLQDADPSPEVSAPPFRRLRVFAFDPSLARNIETAGINQITLNIPWEGNEKGKSLLKPGPVGEYLQVVDYDPASQCFYEPIDLDHQILLAMDGMPPSEGDPKFHQQMVFVVAMKVIEHFERALGRPVFWAPFLLSDQKGAVTEKQFVRRLRIYPHALREANAYYSPQKKAILFGYFPAEVDDPKVLTGGIVFTCLSHDVIAHEMSHAILDGLHPHFAEPSNIDVLALHEAFADIVALFQHFSHPAVLRHEIARTRGELATQNILGQLAQEFGRAIGQYGALRDAIGEVDRVTGKWEPKRPSPDDLRSAREPHARGAILVAAIFDAFLTIYQSRIADLIRIATQGSGILAPGAIHPDLANRLADEAGKTATHLLHICIRALDYCPPIDITFGDYLRAIVTADVDMVPDDRRSYRLAIIEAFQRRGIYPNDVRNLSMESLIWRPPRAQIPLETLFDETASKYSLKPAWKLPATREDMWSQMNENARIVQRWLMDYCSSSTANELGLALTVDAPMSIYRKDGMPATEVHSVRLARRTTPNGDQITDFVIEILQRRRGYFDPAKQRRVDEHRGKPPKQDDQGDFTFLGGCTLLINPATLKVRYAITKHILSQARLESQRRFLSGETTNLRATYFGDPLRGQMQNEPFAMLHRPPESEEG